MRTWYTGKRLRVCDADSHINSGLDSTWEASEAFAWTAPRKWLGVKNDHLGFEVLEDSSAWCEISSGFSDPVRSGDMLVLETKGSDSEQDQTKRRFLGMGRCCTARSKSLTSLCRLQSHPAQYVSGIPSAAILLSISHPIRCSTRCLANVRARISGPMIAL